MPERKSFHIPGLLKVAVAVLVAGALLVVSVSAVGSKDKEKINNIRVSIQDADGHHYISQKEVFSVLYKSAGGDPKHQTIGSLDLSYLEKQLMKFKWIKRADMFIDNQNILQVNIEQNKPIARIFSSGSNSFFVSDNGVVLPFNNEVSVRLPMFTGFRGNPDKLIRADSSVLDDVIRIAAYINNNAFWTAQIDQVDITPSGGFEMIPKLGNQIIRFGDAGDCDLKFSKLLAFYKQIENKTGWDKYSVIDLRFKNQVVAERRDAAEVKSDSLAAIRIMKSIIENARRNEEDTSFFQLPEKPVSERPEPVLRKEDNSLETIPETIPEANPEKANPASSPAVSVLKPLGEMSNDGIKTREPENKNEKIPETTVKHASAKTNPNESNPNKTGMRKTKPATRSKSVDKPEKKIPKAIMPPKIEN